MKRRAVFLRQLSLSTKYFSLSEVSSQAFAWLLSDERKFIGIVWERMADRCRQTKSSQCDSIQRYKVGTTSACLR